MKGKIGTKLYDYSSSSNRNGLVTVWTDLKFKIMMYDYSSSFGGDGLATVWTNLKIQNDDTVGGIIQFN